MSEKVSGSINRGRGNDQVTVTFSGDLKPAQWEAFIAGVTQVAKNHKVEVNEFSKPKKRG